jgi:DnaJ like chaperone protein
MQVWGKVLGAIFGFMFGGVLGALLGIVLGHSFDNGFNEINSLNFGSAKLEQVKSEFFRATFSVMGHLARADGVVTELEIKMATRLMDEMRLSKEQRMLAIELFRAGKRNDFDLDLTIKNLMMACSWRYDLLQIFMEIQFQAAYSDGDIKLQEKEMLMYLCQKLKFSRTDYNRFEALYGYKYSGYNYKQQSSTTPNFTNSLEKAYKILGVDNNISESALKKAYRKLISQHHPDKLVSKGLPEEMLKMATEKTQEIKSAYEQIKLAKGWR